MANQNRNSTTSSALLILYGLQVLAVVIYPPAFLRAAPQAQVLPPALLLLFVLAAAAMNSGMMSPAAARSSFVFIQGINLVVRLIMLLPNLQNEAGRWDWVLLIVQLLAIGISWYTMLQMEKRAPASLMLRNPKQKQASE